MINMRFKKFSTKLIIIIMTASLWLVPSYGLMAGPVLPLDREAVFCSYFKMSGEKLYFQDIEDLYHAQGKSTFSLYKPDELFSKNSLRYSRKRLLNRMRKSSQNSMFAWEFMCTFKPDRSRDSGYQLIPDLDGLPRATPYISSELSKNGRQAVNRALGSLVTGKSFLKKERALKVTVYLVPEKTERQIEKRVIGLEDVFFPIRHVFFRPVGIGLFLPGDPGDDMSFYEIGETPQYRGLVLNNPTRNKDETIRIMSKK